MSACRRTHQLDALVAGEVPAVIEHDLRAHTEHCALCRHELNWLETERRMVRQRAGRDEVEHLWRQTMPQRTGRGSAARLLVGLAATLLLVMNTERLVTWLQPAFSGRAAVVEGPLTVDEVWDLQSIEAMTRFDPSAPEAICSQVSPGLGFHCGSVPASFMASR